MDTSSSSLVSRARIALHSAAAKAEKVLNEITLDLKPDRDGDKSSQRRLKASMEELGDVPREESNSEEINGESATGDVHGIEVSKDAPIAPTSVVKKLAIAIENAGRFSSISDILDSTSGSYLASERALSFSAVRSLVLHQKDKSDSDSHYDEGNHLVTCLFSAVDHSSRYISSSLSMDLKDIRGAPIGSFVVRVAEIIGSLKSLHQMASFWRASVAAIKRLWTERKPIPHMPLDEKPDLNCCLLYQQLQVINCCIARKERHAIALKAMEAVINHNNSICLDAHDLSKRLLNPAVYAKTKTGEYVLRLGAEQSFENQTMLETGEPIYSPVTQEGPVLTEEHIREAEEFMLRTGSLGAGCSQLLSDMQAFKAANPGCILEDFIRWHSPPDWMVANSSDVDLSLKKGQLSRRMQKEGNLWYELWETAKALPAVSQAPLFDEDLVVESILETLEDISPSQFFEQLFISTLLSALIITEAKLSTGNSLFKVFNNCKGFVIAVCRDGVCRDKLKDLCKVYETVEMILLHHEDAIEIQKEEMISTEPRGLFRKFGLGIAGRAAKLCQHSFEGAKKSVDDKGTNVFSNLLDGKESLFSRNRKRSDNPSTH